MFVFDTMVTSHKEKKNIQLLRANEFLDLILDGHYLRCLGPFSCVKDGGHLARRDAVRTPS